MSDEDWPIDIERARVKLHWKSLRSLRKHCRLHGVGRLVSGTIIFSRAEFEALYESLPRAGRWMTAPVPMRSVVREIRDYRRHVSEQERAPDRKC